MALIKSPPVAWAALLLAALSGCSAVGPRQSPLVDVTKNSPGVLELYRSTAAGSANPSQADLPRQRLQQQSRARPIDASDALNKRYWSALEPLNQRFARVPNPDLVMLVFPHLAKGGYPVPGYVTTFPMYEQVHYALPGEVPQELARAQSVPASKAKIDAKPAH